MTLTRPPDWTEAAACVGLATRDRDLWAPGDHLTPEQQGFELHLARSICARCPVRMECVTDELANLTRAEPVAMRGGLTPAELIDLAQAMGLPHLPVKPHGIRSRYASGECRCALCRDAHRVYEHERRLWAGSRRPRTTRDEVHAWLTRPMGRGRRRAEAGQLLLFTTGLPEKTYTEPTKETARCPA